MLPNAIIAGTNKAGTTSVFRYLADHPQVCASRIKEVRHFTGDAEPLTPAGLARYAQQFSGCTDEPVRLEASPDYLAGGQRIARMIQQVLPDARLLVILREPVDRLVSGFLRRKSRDEPALRGMELQHYIDALVAGEQPAAADLAAVCYGRLLGEFLEVIPAERVAVRFFDDLRTATPAFVADVCTFFELDAGFYAGYDFAVENRTRAIRNPALHGMVHRLNKRVEPLLNRYPGLRRGLRRLYNRANTSSDSGAQPAADTRALQAALEADERALAQLLTARYPGCALPAWLQTFAGTRS